MEKIWRRQSLLKLQIADAYKNKKKRFKNLGGVEGLPVWSGTPPGKVVVGTGCGAGNDGLLHGRHVSRVGFEE